VIGKLNLFLHKNFNPYFLQQAFENKLDYE